jgi:glycosyltransferase involved in cell wall biosynthesis
MLLFFYAFIALLFWIALTLFILYGRSRMHFLNRVEVTQAVAEPVVIIIAVRNEEEHLAQALQSVCQLQYSAYRILIINDRSTDGTAEILKDFEARYEHVSVLTITALPEGWLGKNHALYMGYKHSTEAWMLFADADVAFEPHTLQKAVQHCQQHKLDHLTVLPEVQSRSALLNSLMATFLVLLEMRQRPWAARNPKSKASLGVGAFNMVKRSAYEKAGMHAAIALRPDDDLKLGERIKSSGGRQDAVYGIHQIGLEWYSSVKEFVNGLMKNTFAVFDYNLLKVVFMGVMPLLFLLVLPLPVLFIFGSATEVGMGIALFFAQLVLFAWPGGMRTQWWYAVMVPFAGALLVYILLKAAITTLRQGGIYWRDSFYALHELRKAR